MDEATKPFDDLLREMTPRQLRNSLKGAYRKVAKRAKEIAAGKMETSGLAVMGRKSDMKKAIRTRIYSRGGGFMVTVKPDRQQKKSMHLNRRGLLKPVLMWAEEGTVGRFTRNGQRRAHATGSMPAFHFMADSEDEMGQEVERGLYPELEAAVEKQARKAGLI